MFIEADPAIKEQYFAQFEEQFFMFCNKELEKVNTFFAGLLFILLGQRPLPLILKGKDPNPSYSKGKDPPSYSKGKDPYPSYSKGKDPYPSYSKGKDPYPSYSKGKDPSSLLSPSSSQTPSQLVKFYHTAECNCN